jgi:hypothetical protein
MQLNSRDWGRVPKEPAGSGRYRCSKCREWKQPTEFNKNKQQKTGLNYACRPCTRVHTRHYNLPTKYGITKERFKQMLDEQGNKCACCGSKFSETGLKTDRACVDHNHKTGLVRSILCGRCNLAAGNVLDSSQRADQIAAYLRKWNC